MMIWFILSLLFLYRHVSETVTLLCDDLPYKAIRLVSPRTRPAQIFGVCRQRHNMAN